VKLWLAAAILTLATAQAAWADESLIDAARAGDTAAIQKLIAGGADVNKPDVDGTTAIIYAAHDGNAALVAALIKAGADVRHANDYGASAMMEAATVGNGPILEDLLKAGADPDSANPEGQTALMAAARSGRIEAAKVLLKHGAHVNLKESWGGQSALMWAASQSQAEMVKLLIDHGADVNAQGKIRQWPRKVTAEHRPKDMGKGGFTPLLYAARQGCVDCAKYLVAGGADLNATDPDRVTPLNLALINFHFDFAAYLIQAGANVDKWDLYGRTPLYNAVDMNTLPSGGRADVPSTDKLTGLDVARLLLEAGADPNIQLKLRPPYRNVPFDRGADVILSTGATPLLRAAKASDNEAIKLLIAHHALVDLPNAMGVTPLMAAAGLGQESRATRGRYKTEEEGIESARLLLAAGANIDARAGNPLTARANVFDPQNPGNRGSYAGQTALHGAAKKGWTKMVAFLAKNGAELELADGAGNTPLDMAAGNYKAGFLDAPPEPFPDTVALLKKLISEKKAAKL
jgi:ankyrin repeat protein